MVTAIFTCLNKIDEEEDGNGGSVHLQPYADADGQYAEYFAATPGGECRLEILNQAALDQFEPGANYRVTFERIED